MNEPIPRYYSTVWVYDFPVATRAPGGRAFTFVTWGDHRFRDAVEAALDAYPDAAGAWVLDHDLFVGPVEERALGD